MGQQESIIEVIDRAQMFERNGQILELIINDTPVRGKIHVSKNGAIFFFHNKYKLAQKFRKQSGAKLHHAYQKKGWEKLIPYQVGQVFEDPKDQIGSDIKWLRYDQAIIDDCTDSDSLHIALHAEIEQSIDRTPFDFMVKKSDRLQEWMRSRCEQIEQEIEENTQEHMIAKERLQAEWRTRNDMLRSEYDRYKHALSNS